MKDVNAFLLACQQHVNAALDHYLPNIKSEPQRLHQAMRYAVLNGGKRIRPALIYATGELVKADHDILDLAACAIEIVHSYSLVHDDLPAMDNDDFRRGLPTCHKAYDEATAILAGDALQCLAFQLLTVQDVPSFKASQQVAMINCLAIACSSIGMVGGQAIDLAAMNQQINLAQLENMHRLKTGALINAAIELAIIAGEQVSPIEAQALRQTAQCLGLAFQIRDDILDVEGNFATTGKTQGADNALNKPTYPSVMGLTAAKDKARALYEEAVTHLNCFGARASTLLSLADYIVNREK